MSDNKNRSILVLAIALLFIFVTMTAENFKNSENENYISQIFEREMPEIEKDDSPYTKPYDIDISQLEKINALKEKELNILNEKVQSNEIILKNRTLKYVSNLALDDFPELMNIYIKYSMRLKVGDFVSSGIFYDEISKIAYIVSIGDGAVYEYNY